MKLGERVFRILVGLLPGEFRGDFGGAIAAAVGHDADWWTREIPGLIAAIVREHLDALRQDLKYAFRMMRRTPGFTLMAILMLALGTGVNVAMFSVIDAVMLRSPFVDAGELATLRAVGADGEVSNARVDQIADIAALPAIAGVGIISSGNHALTRASEPLNLDNMSCVSASMFDVLKTPPLIGRAFGKDDDQIGAAPTVVLAYTFWKTLGGSDSILGTSLSINHTPVTVIGVMPKGYYGAWTRPNTPGWMPYHHPVADADNAGCRQGATESMVVRLRAGVTRQSAGALMPGFQFGVVESVWMDSVRTPLKVISTAVLCVLLIACLNVGGLQMERTLARRRELSVRLALGAGRGRIARQILTENMLLAAIGAGAGIGATTLSVRAIIAFLPANVPYMDEIAVNARVLGAAIAVAAAAGLASGLFPLLETRRFAAVEGLAGSSSRATDRRSSWTRNGLIVAQIALSLVVLIGAGLMIQTFRTLNPVTPGFDPDHKLWQPARLRGATPEASAAFYRDLFARLHGAPGIVDVAGTTYVPLIGLTGISTFDVNGSRLRPYTNVVTPNYFSLMKIPMVAGRGFSASDTISTPPVVIVNEALAHKIDPSGNVVGRRLTMNLALVGLPGPPSERTIVGVLANTRGDGGDLRARPEAYLPHAQGPRPALTLIVEYRPGASAEATASIRNAIIAIRPDFAITPPSDLREMIERPVDTLRFGARVLTLFAALAMLLAGIGLMTTISWWVTQRTRELGVRMALGATRTQLAGLVARQGLMLAALGVVTGCGVAALVTRYMSTWIFGVTPLDPRTFAGGALLMLLVALVAIFFPTRRATRVDPVVALRAE